jgi:hypothetical protein
MSVSTGSVLRAKYCTTPQSIDGTHSGMLLLPKLTSATSSPASRVDGPNMNDPFNGSERLR